MQTNSWQTFYFLFLFFFFLIELWIWHECSLPHNANVKHFDLVRSKCNSVSHFLSHFYFHLNQIHSCTKIKWVVPISFTQNSTSTSPIYHSPNSFCCCCCWCLAYLLVSPHQCVCSINWKCLYVFWWSILSSLSLKHVFPIRPRACQSVCILTLKVLFPFVHPIHFHTPLPFNVKSFTFSSFTQTDPMTFDSWLCNQGKNSLFTKFFLSHL